MRFGFEPFFLVFPRHVTVWIAQRLVQCARAHAVTQVMAQHRFLGWFAAGHNSVMCVPAKERYVVASRVTCVADVGKGCVSGRLTVGMIARTPAREACKVVFVTRPHFSTSWFTISADFNFSCMIYA